MIANLGIKSTDAILASHFAVSFKLLALPKPVTHKEFPFKPISFLLVQRIEDPLISGSLLIAYPQLG